MAQIYALRRMILYPTMPLASLSFADRNVSSPYVISNAECVRQVAEVDPLEAHGVPHDVHDEEGAGERQQDQQNAPQAARLLEKEKKKVQKKKK